MGLKKYKCLRLLTVDMGVWIVNIKMLTDAFTVIEDGMFGLTLTKDKYNFYNV